MHNNIRERISIPISISISIVIFIPVPASFNRFETRENRRSEICSEARSYSYHVAVNTYDHHHHHHYSPLASQYEGHHFLLTNHHAMLGRRCHESSPQSIFCIKKANMSQGLSPYCSPTISITNTSFVLQNLAFDSTS